MRINAYLSFNGACEEAFRFYEKCIGGKIVAMMRYEDSPMAEKTAPDMLKRIIHARLEVGENTIMGGDSPPNYYSKPAGYCNSITVKEPKEAERIFAALGENGDIQMSMQETFWAHRFGMLTDKFGTPWMVNCEREGVGG